MNKATKGAIAAGAAGILLLGGAGTFALWEDTNSIDPAAISTGVLTLGVEPGEWTDVSDPLEPADIANIGNFDIVPGDTITYTVPVTITAEGDNLEGEFKIDKTALNTSAAVAPYLTVAVSNTAAADNAALAVDGNGVISFTTAATYTFDVIVTVDFQDVDDVVGQDANINLAALALTLEQS
jgi:spore coat-associated protein N